MSAERRMNPRRAIDMLEKYLEAADLDRVYDEELLNAFD